MSAIRVMIGEMPLLLRSFVEGILDDDPQFEFVELDGSEAGAGSVQADCDLIVIAAPALDRMPIRDVLPGPGNSFGIVAIASDGLGAEILRVRSDYQPLESGARQSLRQALAAAAGQRSFREDAHKQR